jgi:hypothetical protein
MSATSKLCAEHRWLEAEAAKLLRVVSMSTPDTASVAAIRWRLAQALREHCAREDEVVYDWLIASDDDAAFAAAWRHREKHGRIGEYFTRYVADWPVSRVGREWPAFCAETKAVIAGLAARIVEEEQDLYPHAERVHACRKAA